jgi:hypothetical protein
LNLGDSICARDELTDTRFGCICSDNNPIRQALGGGTLGFELCVSVNFDSNNFNTALGRFAVDVIAVARRHRQAQQFATVCGRSKPRRAWLNIQSVRLAASRQRYLMTFERIFDSRADQHLKPFAPPEEGRASAYFICELFFLLGESGGERGIRTPGTLTGTTDFESAAIDHSAISPRPGKHRILSGARRAGPCGGGETPTVACWHWFHRRKE